VAFAALGLGRFALGMLLPAMGKGLSLTYSEMGLISTANFVGYLLAVVASGRLYTTVGPRRLISLGLILSALSMALVSRATSFWHVFPAYFATGIGSALANVPVMALVSTWFARSTRGRAAGFIVSGIGLGVVLTGIVIPRVNSSLGAEGWRAGWLILCLGAFIVALISAFFLRNNPRELGLAPMGTDPGAKGAAYAHENPSWVIKILGLIYFFYGFTYVIYAPSW
jgi:sugar phosphate permease